METEKKIIGRCPLCGGNVVKTCKGYRCEHNIGDSPSCVLNINAIIGNRKMGGGTVGETPDSIGRFRQQGGQDVPNRAGTCR